MFYKIIYSDTLSHHGILGMKWGKRNGPPYPLDAADHSVSEKKAGWKKSLGGGSGASGGSGSSKKSELKNAKAAYKARKVEAAAKFGKKAASIEGAYKLNAKLSKEDSERLGKYTQELSDDYNASREKYKSEVKAIKEKYKNEDHSKAKTALKIGAAVAVTGVAIYGAKKLHDKYLNDMETKYFNDAKDAARRAYDRTHMVRIKDIDKEGYTIPRFAGDQRSYQRREEFANKFADQLRTEVGRKDFIEKYENSNLGSDEKVLDAIAKATRSTDSKLRLDRNDLYYNNHKPTTEDARRAMKSVKFRAENSDIARRIDLRKSGQQTAEQAKASWGVTLADNTNNTRDYTFMKNRKKK